jgi:hypothetical protein
MTLAEEAVAIAELLERRAWNGTDDIALCVNIAGQLRNIAALHERIRVYRDKLT